MDAGESIPPSMSAEWMKSEEGVVVDGVSATHTKQQIHSAGEQGCGST